jgi:hypothetical protein
LNTSKEIKRKTLPYLTGIDVRTAFKKLQERTRIKGSMMKNGSEDNTKTMGQQIAGIQNRLGLISTTMN